MKALLILVSMWITISAYSQNNTVSAGGTVEGLSYSVGQIFQQQMSVNGWFAMEGLQQPFELHVHTAIKEMDDYSISIYPNPVQRILNVKLATLNKSNINYTIRDLSGRIVQENTFRSTLNKLDLSNLNSGLYLIKISNQTFKIIKR